MLNITNNQNKTLGLINYKNGTINCYTSDFILFSQITVDDEQAVEIMNKMMDNPEIFCDFLMDSYIDIAA